MQKLAEEFASRFSGSQRAHGTYTIFPTAQNNSPKKKGKANTVAGPATVQLWEAHLLGKVGLGVVPIRDDNTCLWGAVDIDKYDLDLPGLEARVAELDLPLIVCRTKSGGAHLYMFASAPVKAGLIQGKLKKCASALGFFDVEIFPKQSELAGPKDVGNWINMPYFDSAKTNRYALKKGRVATAAQFLEMAKEMAVSELELELLNPTSADGELSDGPPCLQKLCSVGFPEGSRNHALFNLGVYYRKKYQDGDHWQDYVFQANQRWMGPGSPQEVIGIIRSLLRKGYEYKCSDLPIVNHCHRTECARRAYGVPNKGAKSEQAKGNRPCILDEIDRPIKCFLPPEGSHDEPIWSFNLAGQQMDVTVDMLMDQRRFLRTVLIRFQRLMLPVTEDRWAQAVNELLSDHPEMVEQAPDAGDEGQLYLHLEAFCTGKSQAREKEEIALGRPWTDAENKMTYFRSSDFLKYLDQQHYRGCDAKRLGAYVRRLGGGHKQFFIKGRNIQCWYCPQFAQQAEPLAGVMIPVDEGAVFCESR